LSIHTSLYIMASYPEGAAEPLQLVSIDEKTGKLQVGESALKMLRAIRTPIGVVAVCGRARTGKSYLLNQLLGRSTGFKLAHSHRPCTKGLWIWSRPFKRVGPDGADYHLVCVRVWCGGVVRACVRARVRALSGLRESAASARRRRAAAVTAAAVCAASALTARASMPAKRA
jgi:hypothetical protein